MHHSIIIPYYDRPGRLKLCLQSIARSARIVGTSDFEVIVLNRLPRGVRCDPRWYASYDCRPGAARFITIATQDDGFNKCDALNYGIACAQGKILSFLDVDAIVGPFWLRAACSLADRPDLTRLCYRVRMLGTADAKLFAELDDWSAEHDMALEKYDTLPRKFEAYGEVNEGRCKDHEADAQPETGAHVFGNSQFTVRREDLGDLRFDGETFPRAGWEDLDFITRFVHQMGDRYWAHIFRDANHALIHFTGPYSHGRHLRAPGWGGHETEQWRRYNARHHHTDV